MISLPAPTSDSACTLRHHRSARRLRLFGSGRGRGLLQRAQLARPYRARCCRRTGALRAVPRYSGAVAHGVCDSARRDFDRCCGGRALGAHALVSIDDEPHAPEHAIEVELPFLQTIFGSLPIVPLLFGSTSAAAVAAHRPGLDR